MLGARIAMLRRTAGLSQAQLADATGLSPSAIGMYEQGRREPSIETLVAMADVLGVSLDLLIRGKPETGADETMLNQLLLQRVTDTDLRLERRGHRPFSRQELAVLFASLLMEP
jgi:transcriptional regulator with XRE-family HTH domain